MLKYWKWQDILAALVVLAGGVMIILRPDLTLNLMATALGALLVVVGILFLLTYFIRREERSMGYDLIIGVIVVAMGVFVFIRTEFVISILPTIFGVALILSGLLKLQRAFDIMKMKMGGWVLMIVFAIISFVLGALVLIDTFRAAEWFMRLVGAGFVYCGLTDLVTAIYVSWKYSKHITQGSAYEDDFPEDDFMEPAGGAADNYGASQTYTPTAEETLFSSPAPDPVPPQEPAASFPEPEAIELSLGDSTGEEP